MPARMPAVGTIWAIYFFLHPDPGKFSLISPSHVCRPTSGEYKVHGAAHQWAHLCNMPRHASDGLQPLSLQRQQVLLLM